MSDCGHCRLFMPLQVTLCPRPVILRRRLRLGQIGVLGQCIKSRKKSGCNQIVSIYNEFVMEWCGHMIESQSANKIWYSGIFNLVLLIAFFLIFDFPMPSVRAEVSSCVKDLKHTDPQCMSASELKSLKAEVDQIFQDENFSELYPLLETLDLDGDLDLLQSRALLFFIDSGQTISGCDAVADLEEIAISRPDVAKSLLDLIYRGAWMQIAAQEGSQIARLYLAESLFRRSIEGMDTLFKLSPNLFYSELLSLLETDSNQDLDSAMRMRVEEQRGKVIGKMNSEGISIVDLKVQSIEPISVICESRY